ncbi:MAG: T9SS type A sorting domain-containing protein [Bacteroidales bacterium]|jgi:hypothetical protein|nr:T9SS type A sorting domain-containing protein [Bacteroidales bacterium]
MKKLFILLVITTGAISSVDGQLLLDENFDYPVGDLITEHGWIAHSGTENCVSVTPSSITYSGYLSSGIGNEISLKNTGEDDHIVFQAQDTGAVYASFIVQIISARTAGDYFVHLGRNTIGTTLRGKVFVKKDAEGHLAFGITHSSSNAAQVSYTPFSYSLNSTYLLVLKYVFVTGPGNDVVSLFINPVIGSPEPLPPITNTDLASDPADIGSFSLRQGAESSAPELKLDGIRIGLHWEDILNPIPGQILVTGTVENGEMNCYNATQTITVAGNPDSFIMQPGGEVTMIAGRNILFQTGTNVLPGAHLRGYITTTSGYCGSQAPSIVTTETKETGITSLQSNRSICKVYPNPTDGLIILDMNDGERAVKGSVSIYRITGERVMKKEVTPDFPITFDLSYQPPGIYVMQVINRDQTEFIKIINQ